MLYLFVSACVLTFITSVSFAALVLIKNPKSKVNRLWAYMGFSVSLWALGLGLMCAAPDKQTATFFLKYIHYLGALMIPAFFLHFVLVLLKLNKQKLWLIVASYSATALLQISNFTGHLAYVEPTWIFNFYTRPGPAYSAFTILFFIIVSYTIFLLFKHYKTSTGIKHNQIGYLFVSMVIGFGGGSTAFFPVFDIHILPVGMFFMFLHIPIMTYAIIKHQLMGIDIFLKKSLLLLFFLTCTIIPTYIVSWILLNWNISILLKTILLTSLVLSIALLIPKLKIRGELKIDNILFGKRFDYRKSLKELHNAFVSKLDLNTLLKTIVATLAKTLDLQEAAIFLKDSDHYKIAYSIGKESQKYEKTILQANSQFIKLLSQGKLIKKSDLFKNINHKQGFNFLNDIHLKLVIPIKSGSELLAFLTIGSMNTDFAFTKEDEDIFSNLSSEMAIAIENAISFKQIQNLNINLDNKVRDRTKKLEKALKELRSAQEQSIRAAKLAGIGTLAAGIAHEINNALNATINSANNMNRFWNKLKQKEAKLEDLFPKMNNAVEIIHKGMERTRNIVDHLMRFSRKNSEGFKKDQIHDGITSTLELLKNELGVRNIKITKDFCDTNEIFCNLAELNQVFFNVLLNAIDAIEKDGKISIKTTNSNHSFIVSIQDNGPGIAKEIKDQIFDPFFTTKPVGKGTGLGLATSYNIVKDHGGTIEVKSKINQGTEFIISLPVESHEHERKQNEKI